MRLGLQVALTVILSIALGLTIALLSFGPPKPFPFSECSDYQLNAPPNTCRPLAPLLLLFAGILLFLTAFSLFRERLKNGRRTAYGPPRVD